ncbi:cysteine desulfurase activator complex subunit SufD [Anaerococcus octavius]|uniref:Cysteine desulfurase activator complex subunit SufD n=1 Tax=Anaerococcus octavius TaxID=54007 RepID=A0A380WVR3_9FIRM|nr:MULTISPECIES: SufD family Fe-S cluster assembly protein [Anaerococcus]MDU7411228.1 SufD family Fe-S cluster assembly protein [Anaerococcus sp.]SUU93128.1 cysteine desulfurase activator complex subunit SufD [Anaerococcus octavius]
MSRLNEMRMYTWNSQGLNYVDTNLGLKEKQEYFKNSEGESIKDLEDAFKAYEYGLSDETKSENKEFRNFSIYRDVEGKKDFESIELKLDDENNILVAGIDINARENSESSFLISALGEGENLYLNSQVRVNVEKDAKVKLVVVTNFGKDSTNLQSINTIVGEDAVLDISYIEIGADYSIVNVKNILKGDRAQVIEDGIYFKEKDQFLDILANNDHYGNDTDSDAMFNGALKDNAHKNWKGVVDLKHGCSKADGKIGDYSMMFSDNVKNKTAPILLCAEKEVAGNHAASVGRLNKEMLFYIMSRGFDKKQAESMMLEATFSKALDKIEDESLRDELKETVHKMNTRN